MEPFNKDFCACYVVCDDLDTFSDAESAMVIIQKAEGSEDAEHSLHNSSDITVLFDEIENGDTDGEIINISDLLDLYALAKTVVATGTVDAKFAALVAKISPDA